MTPPAHTLSIICVALNEAAQVETLKRAIDRLERPGDCGLETLLIDGGSRDDTARSADFDRTEILPGAPISVCRNHGARTATGDWIAYLDADCEPAPDWILRASPWLREGAPTVVGWPAEPPQPGTWIQRAWHLHWIHKNPSRDEMEGVPVVSRQAFRLLTTRNLLMNRSVFEALNGFDEDLTTGEDTDFVRRASAHGIRTLAVPGLRVVHHGEPATLREFFAQQLWHANRDAYRNIGLGEAGGRARWFARLFLLTLGTAVTGLVGAIFAGAWWPVAGAVPLLLLLATPALVIASRARSPGIIPALVLIYGLYGIARSVDLAGLHPSKRSWKSTT